MNAQGEEQNDKGIQTGSEPEVEKAGPEGQSFSMEPAAPAEGPQLSIGSVLSRSFTMLFKKPAIFIGLAFLAAIVPNIITVLFIDSPAVTMSMEVVGTILNLFVQGAIAYGVFKVMGGGNVSFSEVLGHGMKRLVPLIVAAIITGIGIGIGMLLLVIPGLILMCVWAVAIPACAVEDLGPIQCISRSAALTKGQRLRVFVLIVISSVAVMVIVGLASAILLAIFGVNGVVVGIILALAYAFPQAFTSVMIAIIYYDLRLMKEGVSIDKLVAVFD